MLNTFEFGLIRIENENKITVCDTFIRTDVLVEWEYWQLANGEIVAVWIGEED